MISKQEAFVNKSRAVSVSTLFDLLKEAIATNQPDQDIGAQVVAFIQHIEHTQCAEESRFLWKMVLEDRASRQSGLAAAVWSYIRSQGGVLQTAFGTLVGSHDKMMEVLSEDDHYGVDGHCHDGYRSRMKRSLGDIYLGLDRDGGYQAASDDINHAIQRVSRQEAFAISRAHTLESIQLLDVNGGADHSASQQIPIAWVVDRVLATLCQHWFDVPDGEYIQVGGQPITPIDPEQKPSMHCPYHFVMPSRYIFSPHPNPYERATGEAVGKALQTSVLAFFMKMQEQGKEPQGLLSRVVYQTLAHDVERMASTLVGVMMGFLPTVASNLLEVFDQWLSTSDPLSPVKFCVLFQRYKETFGLTTGNEFCEEEAKAAFLAPYLSAAMQHNPVPEMIWRVAKTDQKVQESGLGCPVHSGDKLVLSTLSAVHDLNQKPQDTEQYAEQGSAKVDPVFGRQYNAVPYEGAMYPGTRYQGNGCRPVHACPGFEMAMGVMLGLLAGVLDSGIAEGRSLSGSHIPLVLEWQRI